MIYRDALGRLAEWLSGAPRKPLVIRGARQVGKSTLVREFAAAQGRELIEVNLERRPELDAVFASLDVVAILRELHALTSASIDDQTCILFLDEIQATPHALQALRYFHEERPQLPVVAAGSLLEFTLSNHAFPMPVGRVQYMHLGPLTFQEFLSAAEPELAEWLPSLTPADPWPAAAHRRLVDRLREYVAVGGMPEAAQTFAQGADLRTVSEIHRSLAETYLDDFSKYARQKDLALLHRVFRFVPRNLGRKVKYSRLSPDDRARDVGAAVELLTQARLLAPVYHSHCSGVPLLADISEKHFKLLFLDIGLANYVCGNDWLALQARDNRQFVNEGGLAEQFVGQHLLGFSHELGAPRLTYWLREGKSANAEVDYVCSYGNWIIPLEVKSGARGSLKSLQQFVLQKRPPLAIRFDLNTPSVHRAAHSVATGEGPVRIEFELLSLPLYAVGELPRLIEERRIAQVSEK